MKILLRKTGVYLLTSTIVGNPLEFYYPAPIDVNPVSGILWPQITITKEISEKVEVIALRTFDVEYSDTFTITTIDGEGNFQTFSIPFEVNDNFGVPDIDTGIFPENAILQNLGSNGTSSLKLQLDLFRII